MAKIEYKIPSEGIPLINTVALQLCLYFLSIVSTPDILSAFLATACLLNSHDNETELFVGYF